jgi:hypothetical protein
VESRRPCLALTKSDPQIIERDENSRLLQPRAPCRKHSTSVEATRPEWPHVGFTHRGGTLFNMCAMNDFYNVHITVNIVSRNTLRPPTERKANIHYPAKRLVFHAPPTRRRMWTTHRAGQLPTHSFRFVYYMGVSGSDDKFRFDRCRA